jgi:hypothetical protein
MRALMLVAVSAMAEPLIGESITDIDGEENGEPKTKELPLHPSARRA